MVAENKKFKVGDKVITVRDTPTTAEGWIGFVTSNKVFSGYEVFAQGETGDEAFYEDELELLSVAVNKPIGDGIADDTAAIQEKPQSALDKQVSGNHYKDCGIQPIEYIHANNLSYFQGNVVKYVTRYKDKAGKADLEKAIHYLELMIELEYSDK